MKKITCQLSLLLLVVPTIFAQNLDCANPQDIPQCTPFRIYAALTDPAVGPTTVDTVRGVLSLPAPPTAVAPSLDAAVSTAKTEVENGLRTATVATTAPQSSPARVHASRQNFNIPLSIAINTIDRSKDEQSLVIRFNRINAGPFSAAATGTFTQPKLSTRVEKNIQPEANRATVAKNLTGMLEETDNVSLSIHFAPATPECTQNRISRGACYGTEVRAYDDVLNDMLRRLLGPKGGPSPTADQIALAFRAFVAPIRAKKFSELDNEQQKMLFDFITLQKNQDALDTAAERKRREKAHVPNLAKLIENQPQWTLTLTGSRRDALVGANEQSADLEYQRGRINLNTVYDKCKVDTDCLVAALKDPNTGSFVFGISVKQTDAYAFSALPEGATSEDQVAFPALSIDRLRTYLARLQYGHDLRTAINEKRLRLDYSMTWEQKSGGESDQRDHDTRFVVGTTLSIPLGENVILPVTLKYANHPEFLEDTQKGLGVHFGLTYRLPFKKPA